MPIGSDGGLGMDANGTNWWKQILAQTPSWMKGLGVMWLFVAVYLALPYEGLLGLVVFLIFVLLAVPIFFTWRWLTWRARNNSAKTR
jgi:hypothetical protein